ncbi:antibiotic biosynthesis monooxygenase [Mesorhizobium sp.]|nr:antibiotic biosynthesis monooxygenase [Mesorhizobium sp.]
MTSFVVWVDFRLKLGARDSFRKLVDANATASVRNEAGCRRFDVTEARGPLTPSCCAAVSFLSNP